MAADEHKRGTRKANFCTVPSTSPCNDVAGCANYRTVCKPSWSNFQFVTLRKEAETGILKPVSRSYEAHHLLPVACVTDRFLGDDATIRPAVEQTEWCINNADNMLGMPLWGLTVKWYCSLTALGGSIVANVPPPPFLNIPQHDFNHNRYNIQVKEALKKIAGEVTKADHKLQGQALQSRLNKESGRMKVDLETKGMRKGGTHEGWKLGQQGKTEWNQPFSMAPTGEEDEIPFPVRSFDDKLAAWIERLRRGIVGS